MLLSCFANPCAAGAGAAPGLTRPGGMAREKLGGRRSVASSRAFPLRGTLMTSGTVVGERTPLFIISKDGNGGSRLTASLAHPCLSASRELPASPLGIAA